MYHLECPREREKEKRETHQHVDGERHHEDRDEQIGDGQADDEVVGYRLQGPLSNHGKYNQHVAEQGQTGDDDEDQGPPTVGVRLFVNVRRRPALPRTHNTGRRGAVHVQTQVCPAVVIGRQINESAVIQSIDVIVQIVEHEQVRYPRVILGSGGGRGRDGRREEGRGRTGGVGGCCRVVEPA